MPRRSVDYEPLNKMEKSLCVELDREDVLYGKLKTYLKFYQLCDTPEKNQDYFEWKDVKKIIKLFQWQQNVKLATI